MIARRALAFVAAIAMVAAAAAGRHRIDSHRAEQRDTFRIACATELAAECDVLAERSGGRLRIAVERAGPTATALVGKGSEDAADGWLTLAPWPAMVNAERARTGQAAVLPRTRVLASSSVVLVSFPDRARALGAGCPQQRLGWRCVGDAAGTPWAKHGGPDTWGAVKVGIADPTTQSLGVVEAGAAAAGYFAPAPIDLENDAFIDWLTRLVQNATRDPDLDSALAARGASLDVIATLDAEARPRTGPAVTVVTPAPETRVDVVLAFTAGARGDRLASAVARGAARAFPAARWRAPARAQVPDAGTLDAIWQLAKQLR